MAHLITGYAGYEHIQSADAGAFNAAFFGDGQYVMESSNQFDASIIDNNTVRILDGDLLMYGRHVRIEPDTYEDLTITTGTAGVNRMDLICMTYEKNSSDGTEKAYLQVIKGTETEGTASAPEYTDGNILEGATVNQMPLYQVSVKGVVLSEIAPLFVTIPTYKTLAEKYAAQFQAACESHLDSLGVLNTMEEVDANTQENQLAGALALKELSADVTAKVDTCFQSVSDGKALVASAITDKKVATDATATFAQMAENIAKIVLGSGNATVSDVLTGKTFTNDGGIELTGAMTNRGAWVGATTGSGNIAVPEGYHNGNGYVSGAGAYNAGSNAKASTDKDSLYNALVYSGLVTSDMTFEQMCSALLAKFPATLHVLNSGSFQWCYGHLGYKQGSYSDQWATNTVALTVSSSGTWTYVAYACNTPISVGNYTKLKIKCEFTGFNSASYVYVGYTNTNITGEKSWDLNVYERISNNATTIIEIALTGDIIYPYLSFGVDTTTAIVNILDMWLE